MGIFAKLKKKFGKEKPKEEINNNEKLEKNEEIVNQQKPDKSKDINIELEKDVKSDDVVLEESPINIEEISEIKESPKNLKSEESEEKKGKVKEEKVEKLEEDKTDNDIKIYDKGLSKSRKSFVSKLINITNKYSKITEEFFYELEEILIMADLGVSTVMKFMDILRERVRKEKIDNPKDLKEIIVDELFIIYVNNEIIVNKINYASSGPTVILFIGVNGVGKTTSIAKIAKKELDKGKKVLMVGADTFRAGAVKQLEEWANRLNCSFVGDESLKDPSAVVYNGLDKAIKENYDIVLIDTAGRLQNKVNLMNELEKINRVIGNFIENAPHETLLVVDATTGQNGISQAKTFKEVTNITGVILTKLDGTAKGGIVLAIKDETNLPVKYVGLGESAEDLRVFDIEKYIYGLFKDMIE